MEATIAQPARRGRRIARPLLLAGWIATLATVIVVFSALGGGPLATPALTDLSGWGGWLEVAGPVEVAFAAGRLVVIAVAWYLLGVTVIATIAQLMRWGRLGTVADVLTLPWARRLLQTALGVGLATAALTSVHTPQGPGVPHAVASVAVADVASLQGPAHGDGEHAAMRFVGGTGDERVEMRITAGVEAAVPTWTTAPGDHLWAIAEAVLARAWGRPPTDAELVPYWQALIERNRPALADPANPDLVYPGQVFQLHDPPPDPAGASA
ncbi:MAG TPA: hypothetical protein VM324_16080 [Egibacteraceae bacterium]|nr:hypothetical protein [Egibacteraceae bacterium]